MKKFQFTYNKILLDIKIQPDLFCSLFICAINVSIQYQIYFILSQFLKILLSRISLSS